MTKTIPKEIGGLNDTIETDRQLPQSDFGADVSTRISARELHKYVSGLIGVFLLFSITYPLAMIRVSSQPKFAAYRSHIKSSSR